MTPIVFSQINKAYGTQVVLRDFFATFQPGEAVALMGPSGSGKTTLVRLLMGLETPNAGSISGTAGLRFSCVFQEDRLCPGQSAIQNVALVLPREKQVEIPAALAAVGLQDADIHKPARELSGGQKRRVALVRAVMATSDVLVLDEAFKGLDETSRQQAFAYVRAHLAGRMLVLVTHEKTEAQAFPGQLLTLAQAEV